MWASWGHLVVVHREDGIPMTQSPSKIPTGHTTNYDLEGQFPTQTFWGSNG